MNPSASEHSAIQRECARTQKKKSPCNTEREHEFKRISMSSPDQQYDLRKDGSNAGGRGEHTNAQSNNKNEQGNTSPPRKRRRRD